MGFRGNRGDTQLFPPGTGYIKALMLINYVDSLKVWGLRPHTPSLT
jgi:hypothetical protein